ncbi:hypothetical protein SCHPADRAFT_946603 [Schizopora paradoxa]|uniref:SAM domain-containing protein n=1 Tax=Schizopora paradoxa TaxID=27342 RepID=A0A0H2R392_9AGAM|nr:hypothetical protein SCHPADRAFT_946603 [Schizopora paradoxa]
MAGADREKRDIKPTAKASAAAEVVAPPPKRARGRPRKVVEEPTTPPSKPQRAGRAAKNSSKPPAKNTRSSNRAEVPVAQAVVVEETAGVVEPKEGKAAKNSKKRKATKSCEGEKVSKKVAIDAGPAVRDDFEPNAENFVDTLTAGMDDGTMIEDDEYEEVGDLSSDDGFLDALASTPFPRRRVPPKGRKAVGKLDIKVQVHDGVALRNVNISSKDGLYELLEKIANAMKRPSQSVEMGYEAPWSSKVGQKKNLAYVTNEDELDDFWISLNRYAKGKYTGADDWGAGIVFRNMQDNIQVAKGNARPKETQGSKGRSGDTAAQARNSAQDLVVNAAGQISIGMFCDGHNRLCYKTWDGKCRTYGPEFVAEHSKLLARGEPGVVADQVPSCMTSKLLDFVRPGRKNRAAIHSEAITNTETTSTTGETPHVAPPVETRRSAPPSSRQDDPPGHRGPLDFPTIANWLKRCEEDLERGRDGHAYSSFATTFRLNGCTRIDDISRMTREDLKSLALEDNVEVTIGLINRIHSYAIEDVAIVKKFGKLPW